MLLKHNPVQSSQQTVWTWAVSGLTDRSNAATALFRENNQSV